MGVWRLMLHGKSKVNGHSSSTGNGIVTCKANIYINVHGNVSVKGNTHGNVKVHVNVNVNGTVNGKCNVN